MNQKLLLAAGLIGLWYLWTQNNPTASAWDTRKAAINRAIGTYGVGSPEAVKALATWGNANGVSVDEFANASGYKTTDVRAMFRLNGVNA